MGTPSYMQSVVDRNVVMRRIPLCQNTSFCVIMSIMWCVIFHGEPDTKTRR